MFICYKKNENMIPMVDKAGLGSLIAGIVLILLGGYGIYLYIPEVIMVLKGSLGIIAVLIGLFLAVIGFFIMKE
jgi:hypothetical protein